MTDKLNIKQKRLYANVGQSFMRVSNEIIPVNSKIIYIYLKSFCAGGDVAYPSMKLMTEELGYSRPTLINGIKKLEHLGLLTIEKNKKGGQYSNNTYTLIGDDYFEDCKNEEDFIEIKKQLQSNSNAEDIKNKKTSNNDLIAQSLSLVQNSFYNQISSIKLENIIPEIEKLGEESFDIISVAVDYTKNNNKNVNYLIKVINNWADDNINTKEKALEKINGKPKKKKEVNDWLNQMIGE
ncbi:MAG: DnaD domain protein [Tetragenococcus koreensis]|nr:DnaD domain protein [Tetragenococcus koreensis]